MHELGIVFHIIKEVKSVAIEHNAQHISRVVLSVGEVSTVVPSYLTDCWHWAVQKEPLMAASTDTPEHPACELVVEPIPAVTYCETCHQEYATVAHGKTCPHCGSDKTYLLRGNEVEIKEIEVT